MIEDENALNYIGEELQELQELSPEQESMWSRILDTDVERIQSSMTEIGHFEVVETDTGEIIFEEVYDGHENVYREKKSITLHATAFPVGTQFVIYEPINKGKYGIDTNQY